MEQGEEVPDEPPCPFAEISCRPYRTRAMMSLTIALVSAALHIDNQGITDEGVDLVSVGFLVPWLFVLLVLIHSRYNYRIFESLRIVGPDQNIEHWVLHGEPDSENSKIAYYSGSARWLGSWPTMGDGPKRDDRMLVKLETKKYRSRFANLFSIIQPKYSYRIVPFENWTRSDFPMPSTYGKELTEDEQKEVTEEVLGEYYKEKAEMGELKHEKWGEAMERWHEPIYLLGTSPAEVIELLGYMEVEDDLIDEFSRDIRGWVKVWVPENPNLVEARLEETRAFFEQWYDKNYDESGNLILLPYSESMD